MKNGEKKDNEIRSSQLTLYAWLEIRVHERTLHVHQIYL